MLLDSGADLSLIPYSLGETVGIELDIENRSEVHGIGEGSVPYILSQLKLKIGKVEISARVEWALQKFSIEFREFENRIVLDTH